jgi:tetratricopeptide (TPR) repeat protein/CHAT domain-containing protein
MSARSLLLGLLLTATPLLFAAAPPLGPDRPLTAQERQALSGQGQQAFAQFQMQYGAGRLQEAIESAKQIVALHEKLYGAQTETVADWLAWIAEQSRQVGADEQAISSAERAYRLRLRLYPAGDWRIVDARLNLEEARNQAKRDEPTRRELRRAGQRNGQVFRLWQQGKSKEALPLAREALDIRHKILGEKHPETAQSLFNLGAQYQALHQLRQAEDCYLRAWDIHKEVLGEKHPRYADSLNSLASLYHDLGEYGRARPLFEQALALRKELLGQKHADYARSLNNLATLYKDMGEYARARSLYEQALALRKEVVGEKHPDYARSLNNLALLYQQMGEYGRARSLSEQTLALRKELLGEKHPDYATSLNNLALLYQKMGEYARARPLYEQALTLTKELLGEKHPRYATSLDNLASLYLEWGEYARARPLYEQALAITKEVQGEKHPHYATRLNNLAHLYQVMGEYARARSLLEQALALTREVLGEKHPRYALSLHSLASLYQDMGEYARARPLYEQAQALLKEVLGQKHPDYARSLNTLASLYKDMGEYVRARLLCEQALAIYQEVLGEKHPYYASSLNSLAFLDHAMGEYARARLLYERSRAISGEVLGEKHPHYATCLNNLATLYRAMGEYARARPLFEQSLALRKEVLGEKHPDYAHSLNNLAGIYQDMGEYARARPLFEQSLALRKEVLGQKHPAYAICLSNLALLTWQEGQPEQASREIAQALQIAQRHLDDTFSALSSRQRLQLLAQTRRYLNDYLSLSAEARVPAATAYAEVLSWKGMVTARLAQEYRLRDNPVLAPLLEQLRLKRAGLAHLSAHPPTPADLAQWRKRYQELDGEREDLEFRLAEKSAAFRSLRAPEVKAVAAALPPRSALIDLLDYTHWSPSPRSPGQWLHERRLAAFVVVKDKEVVRIDLGAVQPIAEAVLAWRRPMQRLSAVDEKAAGQLRRLLWDKLAKAVGEADTVLVAADGVLCALPWSALPGSKPGTYLIEEVAIAQIPSARQLLPQPERTMSAGLLALGGLDYGKKEAAGKAWVVLPGTALEARALVRQHQERFPKGRPARLLEGATVDKAALAAALAPARGEPGWRQIHLATHGYFDQHNQTTLALAGRGALSGPAGEEPVSLHLDPLLGCGLVLSGANQDSERGTLTALEVADLDLRGCEILMLSACETGLGKLEAGEGVLGLQSAFHLAGARTVVASLWNVSDPATSVLMEKFYNYLWAEKPLSRLEALRQAQLFVLKHPEAVRERARELREAIVKAGRGTAEELRGKGKEVGLAEPGVPATALSHPAWWAPFVLSGDIGPVKP